MHQLLGISLLCLLAACSASEESAAPVQASGGVASLDGVFAHTTMSIEADDGQRHEFTVYLATEFEQQRRGLMFVRSMPADVGMLFVYEDKDFRSMWMKNTYIPLDLVFAHADGRVSSVIHDATPLSLQSRGSIEPIDYVLELNGGVARRLKIGRESRLILDGLRAD